MIAVYKVKKNNKILLIYILFSLSVRYCIYLNILGLPFLYILEYKTEYFPFKSHKNLFIHVAKTLH